MYCYIDMDGVLVECFGAAVAANGFKAKQADLTYELPSQFGTTGPSFWGCLDYEFWANLDWTSEGQELLTEIEKICKDRVVIVTAITQSTDLRGVRDGKAEWIRRNLPAYRQRCFMGAPKAAMAAPDKILIDDHDANCEAFIAAGGHSILVPRPWNKARLQTDAHGNFSVPDVIKHLTTKWR